MLFTDGLTGRAELALGIAADQESGTRNWDFPPLMHAGCHYQTKFHNTLASAASRPRPYRRAGGIRYEKSYRSADSGHRVAQAAAASSGDGAVVGLQHG